mgnify:CR=1 FL=1
MSQKILHQQPPSLLAFAALLAGNIAIAFGPLLVRFADSGPIATGFWRLALATPFLFFVRYRFGFRFSALCKSTIWLATIAGLFFGVDIILWHIGIFQTKMANATLFANCASLILVVYGIFVARKMPSKWESAAVLFAFVGAALLMGQSLDLSPRHFQGDILSLAAGLTYTVYLVLMMRVRQNTESWGALGMASAVAAVILLSASIVAAGQNLQLGWQNGFAFDMSQSGTGAVARLVLENVRRDDAYLTANSNLWAMPPNDANSLGRWQCYEATGTTVSDSGPNGYNVTLASATWWAGDAGSGNDLAPATTLINKECPRAAAGRFGYFAGRVSPFARF